MPPVTEEGLMEIFINQLSDHISNGSVTKSSISAAIQKTLQTGVKTRAAISEIVDMRSSHWRKE